MGYSTFTQNIIDEYQHDGRIVGEENNITAGFYSLMSAYYPREFRQHIAFDSTSGAGKSTIAGGLVAPFQKYFNEDLIELDGFTIPGLVRMPTLDGRILYIRQAFATESRLTLALESEGDLRIQIAKQVEGTKNFVSEPVETKGKPCVLTTTTDILSSERKRRFLICTVDESPTQTNRITLAKAIRASELPKASLHAPFSLIKEVIERVRRLLPPEGKTIPLMPLVPYAPQMQSALKSEIEERSTFDHVINLIRSCAIVKSICGDKGRSLYAVDPKSETPALKHPLQVLVAIATKEDFDDVWNAVGLQAFQGLNFTQSEILRHLKLSVKQVQDRLDKEPREEFQALTYKDLQRLTKKKEKTVRDACKVLQDAGYITLQAKEGNPANFWLFDHFPSAIDIQVEDVGPEDYLTQKGLNFISVDSESPPTSEPSEADNTNIVEFLP